MGGCIGVLCEFIPVYVWESINVWERICVVMCACVCVCVSGGSGIKCKCADEWTQFPYVPTKKRSAFALHVVPLHITSCLRTTCGAFARHVVPSHST